MERLHMIGSRTITNIRYADDTDAVSEKKKTKTKKGTRSSSGKSR